MATTRPALTPSRVNDRPQPPPPPAPPVLLGAFDIVKVGADKSNGKSRVLLIREDALFFIDVEGRGAEDGKYPDVIKRHIPVGKLQSVTLYSSAKTIVVGVYGEHDIYMAVQQRCAEDDLGEILGVCASSSSSQNNNGGRLRENFRFPAMSAEEREERIEHRFGGGDSSALSKERIAKANSECYTTLKTLVTSLDFDSSYVDLVEASLSIDNKAFTRDVLPDLILDKRQFPYFNDVLSSTAAEESAAAQLSGAPPSSVIMRKKAQQRLEAYVGCLRAALARSPGSPLSPGGSATTNGVSSPMRYQTPLSSPGGGKGSGFADPKSNNNNNNNPSISSAYGVPGAPPPITTQTRITLSFWDSMRPALSASLSLAKLPPSVHPQLAKEHIVMMGAVFVRFGAAAVESGDPLGNNASALRPPDSQQQQQFTILFTPLKMLFISKGRIARQYSLFTLRRMDLTELVEGVREITLHFIDDVTSSVTFGLENTNMNGSFAASQSMNASQNLGASQLYRSGVAGSSPTRTVVSGPSAKAQTNDINAIGNVVRFLLKREGIDLPRKHFGKDGTSLTKDAFVAATSGPITIADAAGEPIAASESTRFTPSQEGADRLRQSVNSAHNSSSAGNKRDSFSTGPPVPIAGIADSGSVVLPPKNRDLLPPTQSPPTSPTSNKFSSSDSAVKYLSTKEFSDLSQEDRKVAIADSLEAERKLSAKVPDFKQPIDQESMKFHGPKLAIGRQILRLTSKGSWEPRTLLVQLNGFILICDKKMIVRRSIPLAQITEVALLSHWEGPAIAIGVSTEHDLVFKLADPRILTLQQIIDVISYLQPDIKIGNTEYYAGREALRKVLDSNRNFNKPKDYMTIDQEMKLVKSGLTSPKSLKLVREPSNVYDARGNLTPRRVMNSPMRRTSTDTPQTPKSTTITNNQSFGNVRSATFRSDEDPTNAAERAIEMPALERSVAAAAPPSPTSQSSVQNASPKTPPLGKSPAKGTPTPVQPSSSIPSSRVTTATAAPSSTSSAVKKATDEAIYVTGLNSSLTNNDSIVIHTNNTSFVDKERGSIMHQLLSTGNHQNGYEHSTASTSRSISTSSQQPTPPPNVAAAAFTNAVTNSTSNTNGQETLAQTQSRKIEDVLDRSRGSNASTALSQGTSVRGLGRGETTNAKIADQGRGAPMPKSGSEELFQSPTPEELSAATLGAAPPPLLVPISTSASKNDQLVARGSAQAESPARGAAATAASSRPPLGASHPSASNINNASVPIPPARATTPKKVAAPSAAIDQIAQQQQARGATPLRRGTVSNVGAGTDTNVSSPPPVYQQVTHVQNLSARDRLLQQRALVDAQLAKLEKGEDGDDFNNEATINGEANLTALSAIRRQNQSLDRSRQATYYEEDDDDDTEGDEGHAHLGAHRGVKSAVVVKSESGSTYIHPFSQRGVSASSTLAKEASTVAAPLPTSAYKVVPASTPQPQSPLAAAQASSSRSTIFSTPNRVVREKSQPVQREGFGIITSESVSSPSPAYNATTSASHASYGNRGYSPSSAAHYKPSSLNGNPHNLTSTIQARLREKLMIKTPTTVVSSTNGNTKTPSYSSYREGDEDLDSYSTAAGSAATRRWVAQRAVMPPPSGGYHSAPSATLLIDKRQVQRDAESMLVTTFRIKLGAVDVLVAHLRGHFVKSILEAAEADAKTLFPPLPSPRASPVASRYASAYRNSTTTSKPAVAAATTNPPAAPPPAAPLFTADGKNAPITIEAASGPWDSLMHSDKVVMVCAELPLVVCISRYSFALLLNGANREGALVESDGVTAMATPTAEGVSPITSIAAVERTASTVNVYDENRSANSSIIVDGKTPSVLSGSNSAAQATTSSVAALLAATPMRFHGMGPSRPDPFFRTAARILCRSGNSYRWAPLSISRVLEAVGQGGSLTRLVDQHELAVAALAK